MLQLKIKIRPKRIKYLEFSQSLESLKTDLIKQCASLLITKKNKSFTIITELNSIEKLIRFLSSKELILLSGAIRMLTEKPEITIHCAGHQNKGSDLREIRLDYLKKQKKQPFSEI